MRITVEGAQDAALRAARPHTAPRPSHEETCKPCRPLGCVVTTGMSPQANAEQSDEPDRNPLSDVHDDAVTVSVRALDRPGWAYQTLGLPAPDTGVCLQRVTA